MTIDHKFNGFRLVGLCGNAVLVQYDPTVPANFTQCLRGMTIHRNDMPGIAGFIRRNAIEQFAPKIFQFGDIIVTIKMENGKKIVDLSHEEWESRKPIFQFDVSEDAPALLMFVTVLETPEGVVL